MKNTLNIVLVIGLLSPITVFAADNSILQVSHVHIRSLAASCAACHGTQGKAVSSSAMTTASLAGADKAQLVAKLMAYKSGASSATVMQRHAKGLTDEEIHGLAEYFSAQPAGAATVLNPQKLRADHER